MALVKSLTTRLLMTVSSITLVGALTATAVWAEAGAGGNAGGPGGTAGASNNGTAGGPGGDGTDNSFGGAGGGGGGAGTSGGMGGTGGDSTPSSGGLGGAGAASAGAVGAVGTVGAVNGGGGGGGGGAHGFVDAALPTIGATGGVGGAGGAAPGSGGGGGGGAGGFGAVNTGAVGTLGVGVTGGAGGVGGASVNAFGGGAGDGGVGLSLIGGTAQSFIINAGITGGAGGAGGAGIVGGAGGDGGIGLLVSGGGTTTLTIGAGITGGIGGAGGLGFTLGAVGPSGAGIVGQNLAITMGGAGLVTAGAGANAITFTGGANSLTFANGTSGLIGALSVTGGLDFDQSSVDTTVANTILGSGSITKTGSALITLTGANTYGGTTIVNSGQLRAASVGALGASTGALVVNGGTLDIDVAQAKANLSGTGGTINLDADLTIAQSLAQTYAGAFTGTGGFIKNGAADLTVSGDSSTFTGDVTVAAGGLLVNNTVGTFGAATSEISVDASATLGGNGMIGGNVLIGDGATLSPGALNTEPGTLAILGDLFVSSGSILDYDLGQAYTVGGAFNDLVTVGGDLTLDGTLNVTASAGGTFDPGIYRLISYTGTFTDNGLTIGTIPAPGSYVQTSIANQVNLVNTQGLTLSYWDGSTIPRNNNTVDGGTGTWQSSAGNDSWTEGTGALNGSYQDASFAIFAGTPGTVTVDNSLGAVDSSGMQFATDGYQLVGGVITLSGSPSSIIRVGDGTVGGAAISATIDSELTGASQLVKTDLGTLVLGGTNSYTGGTAIEGGTLTIADDLNLGAASGNLVLDGGTLRTTADIATARALAMSSSGGLLTDAGTTLTLNGAVSGAGSFDKAGSGTLIIAGAASHTGGTTINAGTVQVGNGGTTGSLAGNVANAGVLAFDRSDDSIFAGATSGVGSLVQRGLGTTVLTGANTHTGGSIIISGALQIGNGGTSGSLTGNVSNAGILAFDRSDAMSFNGVISGIGQIRQLGTGMTTLTANSSSFVGQTRISAGILSVNGQLGGTLTVAGGGTLMGNGTVGTTTNEVGGLIAPGNSIGTLTINGNYIGTGGNLEIEAVLGGDSSPADRLIVTGDTAGVTSVDVINLGGIGAPTIEGIKIVDIGGASNGTFALLGSYVFEGEQAVVAGAYGYRLYKDGVSTPADGDWYLRSALLDPSIPGVPTVPLYQPGAPVYEAYANVLQSFNSLETMRQRVGNRSWTSDGVDTGTLPDAAASGSGIWGRITGSHLGIDSKTSTTDAAYEVDIWQLQAGADALLDDGTAGQLTGGVWARYGTLAADITSPYGAGSISATGYGVGATLTWQAESGFYLDAQANLTWYDSDLSSTTAATSLASGIDGFGYALGLEMGQEIALGANWSIIPQVQLVHSAVDYDDFTDAFGASVSLLDGDSLKGRLGISADYQTALTDASGQTSRLHAYGIANIHYEFLSGAQTDLAGVKLTSEEEPLWGGVGVGGSYSWADDKYALHTEVTVNTSLGNFGDSYHVTGTAGFRVKF
ncbi:autotransporter outer membrane beta-barrel domain-containing protein [Rhizobium leguminosarum]|uniref:autotransporter outer membrane beta-barrel domain-containing protein n=1 Tax=Rhizobium leguminosarum TaxID=384 RepID=UPI001C94CF01|nr:autotransporter outer membrane beta-barrel domain-containing protein [Rhizobium leguminosarum]MBY5793605.1 autotransporter outer membrane beta-barrel domain-containing protein [Rhizobium leguminosarum]